MRNPEFERYLWQEISLHRLAIMPLWLFACAFIMAAIGADIDFTLLFLFALLTGLWGAGMVSDAMNEEILNHTWDWQRMSPISAWQLMWGKLFGSTIYAWYGGVWCLLLFVFTGNSADFSVIQMLLIAVLLALFIHLLVFLLSLVMVLKQDVLSRQRWGLPLLASLLLLSSLSIFSEYDDGIVWFGNVYEQTWFYIVSLVFFIAWLLIGVHLLMRKALQFQNSPLVWGSFLICLWLYLLGHLMNEGLVGILFSTYASTAAFVYLLLLSEYKGKAYFIQLQHLYEQKNYSTLWRQAPRWFISTLLAFIIIVFSSFYILLLDNNEENRQIISVFISLFIFLLRDIGIVLWINFSGYYKRPDVAVVLYWVFLYWLLPLGLSESTDTSVLVLLFWPAPDTSLFLSILIPLVEVILVYYFLSRSYVKHVLRYYRS